MQQPAPLKPRSPTREHTEPLLPRSFSHPSFSRPQVRWPWIGVEWCRCYCTRGRARRAKLAGVQAQVRPICHPPPTLPTCRAPACVHSASHLQRTSSDGVLDRLHRHRPMRSAMLLLLSVILAANCVWAMQGLAAWRRGGRALRLADGEGEQQMLLQRLNSTTLSVEVGAGGRWPMELWGWVRQHTADECGPGGDVGC